MRQDAREGDGPLEEGKEKVLDRALLAFREGDPAVFPDRVLEEEVDLFPELLQVECQPRREGRAVQRPRAVRLDPDQKLDAPLVQRQAGGNAALLHGVLEHRVAGVFQKEQPRLRLVAEHGRYRDARLPEVSVDVQERELLPRRDLVRIRHDDDRSDGGADAVIRSGGGVAGQRDDLRGLRDGRRQQRRERLADRRRRDPPPAS